MKTVMMITIVLIELMFGIGINFTEAKTVTLHVANQPLGNVLKEITKQTDVPTWTDSSVENRPVNVDLDNVPFETAISNVATAANCVVVIDLDLYVLKDATSALPAPPNPYKFMKRRPSNERRPSDINNRPGTFSVLPEKKSLLSQKRRRVTELQSSQELQTPDIEKSVEPGIQTSPTVEWTRMELQTCTPTSVKTYCATPQKKNYFVRSSFCFTQPLNHSIA